MTASDRGTVTFNGKRATPPDDTPENIGSRGWTKKLLRAAKAFGALKRQNIEWQNRMAEMPIRQQTAASVTDDTDPHLVERAAGGDAEAFDRLIERHYDSIYRMAWRWLGSRPDAEDTAQDICIKLALELRGFRAGAKFSTWLYRVTYNAAIDKLRTRQRIKVGTASNIIEPIHIRSQQTPEEAVINIELWGAVRALPAQQRDAVLLVYGEGLSHSEAALVMGCAEKTVSWHLHAARKSLRTELGTAGQAS